MTPSLKRYILAGAAGLLLLCAAGGYAAHRWSIHHTADLAAVQVARADLQRALTEGAVQQAFADGQMRRGDSLQAAVTALKTQARTAHRSDSASRSTFANVAYTSADTCKKVVEAANRALADAAYTDAIDKARADTAEMASDSYRQSAQSALAALVAVSGPAAALGTASGVLASHSRPSFLARIRPKIGGGVAAGVNPAGHFDTVVGLTFGWTF